MGSVRQHREIPGEVASIVLAGGEGTRLFPLTQSRCKPAVSFGGRYRLIDIPISNSLNSNINRIYIISQHLAADLNQYVKSCFTPHQFQRGDIQLLTPIDTPQRKVVFKGTADAVRQNIDHLIKSSAEYFLILSGDQLYNANFMSMVNFAKDTNADLVIATIPVEEAEAKRMGLLRIDATGHVEGFFEKPNTPELLKLYELPEGHFTEKKRPGVKGPHYLGSMGIYVFKRSCLISLLREEGEDFGKHLIPLQVKRGRTYSYIFDGYWEDIGTIASYYKANLALLSNKNCLDMYDEILPIYTKPQQLPNPVIHQTHIENSVIGMGAIVEAQEITGSIVGLRAQIKKGTVIRNSIISGHKSYVGEFSIGENCRIEKAIIDEHSSIGNNVQLINRENLQKYDGDGVYIRDGIIIIPSGTHLPDGFTI
ncbi:MAG: glucose-1-phosphate adenylyltransferase [Chlamydiales bacterium]|nr:glucose-1-phosphate adenylyltransferase [Chlamydiales bacterium]